MAMVKTTLQTALETIFKKQNSAEEAAAQLADAIDAYIRTADVVGTCPSGPVEGSLQ